MSKSNQRFIAKLRRVPVLEHDRIREEAFANALIQREQAPAVQAIVASRPTPAWKLDKRI